MKLLATLKLKFMVWVWQLMPTCAEMTRLTSRALEQPLTFKLRVKMRLHFVMCAWCRRYFAQINFLHAQAARRVSEFDLLPGRGLSPEAKHRLVQRLRAGL